MKLPLNWLKDFVDTKEMCLDELTDEISLKAFEVEDIEIVGKKIISPVVSAKIIDITAHPNADKLRIAQVITKDEKNAETLQIVCGAKNIEVGQVVPLALPRAIVINRHDGTELPIKKSKIRDVESNGMLCSASELGIETSNPDGIHILPSDTPLGLDIVKILGLEPKIVLSIGSRSNRSDALCIQGIAREVSAAIGTELKTDYYENNSKEAFISACEKLSKISCEIESKDFCTGALFLLFENIKITESPSWMKEVLMLSGIKTVNNIVDILNYVMLEIGQPMHAYDADKVKWQNGLQIRKAKENKNEKKFLGLDQNEYELSSERSLLITDSEKLLSLAGIMGGLDSSITNDTKNILIEIACFNQATVRKSSRFSGVSSESSRRFERGTEEELLYVSFKRVNELISQLTDARLMAFSETIIKSSQEEQILELSLKNYEKKIGLAISFHEAQNILEKLGFVILHDKEESIKVQVPSYRKKDITREIDLIEEIARFQGFNKIPLKFLPAMKDAPIKNSELENIKNTLKAQGYFESISSSFVTNEDLELSCNSRNDNTKPIEMKNPISKENAFLRNALLPSMLKVLKYNLNRQIESLKIFEVGKAYAQDENTQTHKLSDRETGTCEKELLGILCSSKIQKTDWKGKEKDIVDFFDLKGTLESLLSGKGKLTFSSVNSGSSVNAQLHTGASALVFLNGREIGFIGKIHPNLSFQKDLPENTFFAQIELEPLLKPRKFKFKSINNNPVMSRDFTIDILRKVFAIGVTNGQIETLIEKAKLENLLEYELTSFYDKSDSDKVSLSYRLRFQAFGDNNLVGDHVNSSVEELKKKILSELPSVKIRN